MDNKEYMKRWGQTEKGKKSRTLSNWRKAKLKGDYDKIYDEWLNTNNCNKCNILLEGRGNSKKCMDHNHITGEFRNIICHNCNMKTQSKQKNNPNVGVGISFVKKKKLWKYRKQTNGKIHSKMCKNLNYLLWYKFVYLLLN